MKNIFVIAFLILLNPVADNVTTRFALPTGYTRQTNEPNGFGNYLQNLPLKPIGTHTKTYQGNIAATDPYTAAVVDISVGHQDLQQCADAVMRLRGEYLYQQKRYNEIAFHFVSGFICDYSHYANGYRYQNDKWVLKTRKDYTYPAFLHYMNLVFAYAGTLSLDKELKKVTNPDDLKAGDVFIHGGSPGHCFVVMDVALNSAHQKMFMLAQSFMPAQNIQVLKYQSPWFSLNKPTSIPYQELIDAKYLKKFD
jgi:hypothetical protein